MKKIVGFVLLFGSIMICSGAELVYAWDFDKFENNKIVNAAVGNLRAAAIRPQQIKSVPGKLGNALKFDGGYRGNKAGALLVRNFKFDFSQPFTVEAIVMFDSNIKRNACREIFNIADTERGPGVRFNFYYGSLALRSGDGKKATHTGTGNTKTDISVGKWHLVTVTYDGKKVSVYFNGVAAGQKEMTIQPAQKQRHLTIGSYKSGYSYPLKGAIDDLKFYKGCKSSAEVAEQYIAIFGE